MLIHVVLSREQLREKTSKELGERGDKETRCAAEAVKQRPHTVCVRSRHIDEDRKTIAYTRCFIRVVAKIGKELGERGTNTN
jgi:hypothetical protein